MVQSLNVCIFLQRKPRVVPNPAPTSPTSSTPEPDTSTVPLDNATIPNSALQAPTGKRHALFFTSVLNAFVWSCTAILTIWNEKIFLFFLKVCVYLNKYGKVGPHLDQRRIQQLPDHFGPGRASSVLQQCVQACVDSAHNQATVFSCLKSGQGGEVISGNADERVACRVTFLRSSVSNLACFLVQPSSTSSSTP